MKEWMTQIIIYNYNHPPHFWGKLETFVLPLKSFIGFVTAQNRFAKVWVAAEGEKGEYKYILSFIPSEMIQHYDLQKECSRTSS